MTRILLAVQRREKAGRGLTGKGIGLASSYVRAFEERAGSRANMKQFMRAHKLRDWGLIIKEAAHKLVYGTKDTGPIGGTVEKPGAGGMPGLDVEVFGTPKRKDAKVLTRGSILDYETILTTNEQDRDKDILEPMGASIDQKMPVLWQHLAVEPIGKHLCEVDRNEKVLTIANGLVSGTEMSENAAKLLEYGALRTSHGFEPKEYEPVSEMNGQGKGWKDSAISGVEEESSGWHVKTYDVLESSLVSIPSNKGAEITAYSRGKMTHPLFKLWTGYEYKNRPAVVKGNWDPEGANAPAAQAPVTVNVNIDGSLLTKGKSHGDVLVEQRGQVWVVVNAQGGSVGMQSYTTREAAEAAASERGFNVVKGKGKKEEGNLYAVNGTAHSANYSQGYRDGWRRQPPKEALEGDPEYMAGYTDGEMDVREGKAKKQFKGKCRKGEDLTYNNYQIVSAEDGIWVYKENDFEGDPVAGPFDTVDEAKEMIDAGLVIAGKGQKAKAMSDDIRVEQDGGGWVVLVNGEMEAGPFDTEEEADDAAADIEVEMDEGRQKSGEEETPMPEESEPVKIGGALLKSIEEDITGLCRAKGLPPEAKTRCEIIRGMIEAVRAKLSASAKTIGKALKDMNIEDIATEHEQMAEAMHSGLKRICRELEQVQGVEGLNETQTDLINQALSAADATRSMVKTYMDGGVEEEGEEMMTASKGLGSDELMGRLNAGEFDSMESFTAEADNYHQQGWMTGDDYLALMQAGRSYFGTAHKSSHKFRVNAGGGRAAVGSDEDGWRLFDSDGMEVTDLTFGTSDDAVAWASLNKAAAKSSDSFWEGADAGSRGKARVVEEGGQFYVLGGDDIGSGRDGPFASHEEAQNVADSIDNLGGLFAEDALPYSEEEVTEKATVEPVMDAKPPAWQVIGINGNVVAGPFTNEMEAHRVSQRISMGYGYDGKSHSVKTATGTLDFGDGNLITWYVAPETGVNPDDTSRFENTGWYSLLFSDQRGRWWNGDSYRTEEEAVAAAQSYTPGKSHSVKTAYDEGFDAAMDGLDANSNPYTPEGSGDGYTKWEEGFYDAMGQRTLAGKSHSTKGVTVEEVSEGVVQVLLDGQLVAGPFTSAQEVQTAISELQSGKSAGGMSQKVAFINWGLLGYGIGSGNEFAIGAAAAGMVVDALIGVLEYFDGGRDRRNQREQDARYEKSWKDVESM